MHTAFYYVFSHSIEAQFLGVLLLDWYIFALISLTEDNIIKLRAEPGILYVLRTQVTEIFIVIWYSFRFPT